MATISKNPDGTINVTNATPAEIAELPLLIARRTFDRAAARAALVAAADADPFDALVFLDAARRYARGREG